MELALLRVPGQWSHDIHSRSRTSWQTREIADAIPKRIAARTRDRMHPDAARKTIRMAVAADHLREALRIRRARRAAVKGAKAPSRSAVPDAVKRKVRVAPAILREADPLRDAGLPPDAVLPEATTPSRRSLSPFFTGLLREARLISGKPRSDYSGSAAG